MIRIPQLPEKNHHAMLCKENPPQKCNSITKIKRHAICFHVPTPRPQF